jgi:hypothetical protein
MTSDVENNDADLGRDGETKANMILSCGGAEPQASHDRNRRRYLGSAKVIYGSTKQAGRGGCDC